MHARRGEAARSRRSSHDGDTLDLTAMLRPPHDRGRAFAMYGFNGEVPGPLIRVPQNATIVVRFHNQIDLPSAYTGTASGSTITSTACRA